MGTQEFQTCNIPCSRISNPRAATNGRPSPAARLSYNGSMSDLRDTHWFAIQVRPCAEAAAELNLRRLAIETLLPLIRRPIRHATRTLRLAARALFPGYLFARFSATDSLRAVSYCRGVVRCSRPATDRFLSTILSSLAFAPESGPMAVSKWKNAGFALTTAFELRRAHWGGWSGVFERELSDSQRVVILIETPSKVAWSSHATF